MISIEKLVVSYGGGNAVLESLDLLLCPAAIHGIVGLNGSGKTSLLNAIYGIRTPDSGTITDRNTGKKPSRKTMAYLVTENYFYSNITGKEYLSLFHEPGFDTEAWNSLFHLPLEVVIDNYSTGMKKKLALMGVLKQDKPLLILDEPFNGLDLESCRVIRSILIKLKQTGKSIIVTSHILESLTNLCDEIHHLEDGRICKSISRERFPEFERELYEGIEQRNADTIARLIVAT